MTYFMADIHKYLFIINDFVDIKIEDDSVFDKGHDQFAYLLTAPGLCE